MIRALLALLVAVAFAVPAHAQTYPSKPIRMIVPFPPGGGTDFVSRTVATELAKSTGWTVVVENKAGAAGTIGLAEVSRATPDGYTWVFMGPSMLANPRIYSNLRWNEKSFTPVAVSITLPGVTS